MCVVSMVGDRYTERWPWATTPIYPAPNTGAGTTTNYPAVSKAEFDALKRDVEEMKELLKAAKAIDVALGEPDCEQDEKLAVLRRVAELVGVDLEDVFG